MENAQATAQALKSANDALETHQSKLNDIQTTLSKECGEARKVMPTVDKNGEGFQVQFFSVSQNGTYMIL